MPFHVVDYDNNTIWFTLYQERHWIIAPIESEISEVLRFREFFDVPIAIHWYNWHKIPFDTDYPEYFPTKEGFKDAVKKLQEFGVRVMPYINGRIFDFNCRSWLLDGAENTALKRVRLA